MRDLKAHGRVVWWGSRVECASAVARLERTAVLSSTQAATIRETLHELLEQTDEVQPTEFVRNRAERLLRVHSLRAADALQLAAALVWCEESPAGNAFVCLDERLRGAATAEGFDVLPRGEP